MQLYNQYLRFYQAWLMQSQKKGVVDYIKLFFSLFKKVYYIISTQFYLRNVKKGSGVVCTQKPSLQIEGRLTIGNNVRIWSSIHQTRLSVFRGAELNIGRGTYINGARISAKYQINIGNHCTIAPEVLIMDSDFHNMNDHSREGISQPINIHNHVWIATRATILKGITIGEHSVVAAGAVVTKDVPAYSVVGGNPARVIKQLN
jgi:acetyltransferase-like isoleucine patch superfamily enzyme